MNQDTGWFNNYDKCGLDQRNHPPSRYNNVATMPQPNQQPRWDPLPGLPPPVGIRHNIQSLHPYGGGFIPNQFHPAYSPRPVGSYQSYSPHNSGHNYRNNPPRMRHGNNNFRWQRRNGHDRTRTFPNSSPGNYQHSMPSTSKQEPNIQEIEVDTPEQTRDTPEQTRDTPEQTRDTPEQTRDPPAATQILDVIPTTATSSTSSMSIQIIEDDDDAVEPEIKEEDKEKLLHECIDLSNEVDSPEECLNKFEFDSKTKVLDKLCGTMDEAQLIEGLKQFKTILKDQMTGIRLKSRLIQLLTKYILFLGMNYKSLASGFVEEYLDLMEDVIAMFCQVITDFINLQIADNKKTHLVRLSFHIKHIISNALLFRLDSIMHCLFKVQLPPLYLEGHSIIWTDVFLYFLRNSKFNAKHDDLLRIFIAWKRLMSIRASKDTEMIKAYMFQSLKKTPEELKLSPYLKEFVEKYYDNPRCNMQEMLNKYWKWWREERPKQHWAGLEEPTYIQLPGAFNLEPQPTNVFLNHSSSETRDHEISKWFQDRRTGKISGLTQLGKRLPYGRQNNIFWPSTSGNIFDDSTNMITDFDYDDDNDLIIAEPRVVETVVLDSDDDDDVIFIGADRELNAQKGIIVVENTTEAVETEAVAETTEAVAETTEAVEKLMEESSINDLNETICENDSNELVDPETSLEVEINEISENNLDESRNETATEEIFDSFIMNYPEDIGSNDENDDLIDFPNAPEENQDQPFSTSNGKSTDYIFDKWEIELNNPDIKIPNFFDYRESSPETRIEEETTSIFDEQTDDNIIQSPEESNDKDYTCHESSKTETVSPQKEIPEVVPEKPTDPIPNNIEVLPELAKTPPSTKCNGLLGICMQDLREVLNEMENDSKQPREESNKEKDSCLKEVPLILEEPLLKQVNLSSDSGDLVIDENVNEDDNLDNSHNYAAIVQAACSDNDDNEFEPMNKDDAKELSEYRDDEGPASQSDLDNLTCDSEEISSPAWEPLDPSEVQQHFDSEKQHFDSESFEKQTRFESVDLSSAVVETSKLSIDSMEPSKKQLLESEPFEKHRRFESVDSSSAVVDASSEKLSNDSMEQLMESEPFEKLTGFESVDLPSTVVDSSETLEPAISPKVNSSCPDSGNLESTVIEDEFCDRMPTTVVQTTESTSTTCRPLSPINLASPCNNNSDIITIQCRLVLKQEIVEEPPQNSMAIDEDYQLNKYPDYPLVVPQRQDLVTAQSGSQPYSPPSIRIGNAVSALDENSTMLYTPILQDSQKIEPAIVPDVLPQQDLPKQDAVPSKPESSPKTNNNHINKFKIVKVHNASPVNGLSSNLFEDTPKDIYAVVYGSKTLDNSQTTEAETPSEKLKKKSRRSSTTKDSDVPHLKSKRRDSNPRVYKGKKSGDEKQVKPQDNGLFEYAIEGPTGKPLFNTTSNILWEDNEEPHAIPKLLKSDKQLKKKGTPLVSILKKSKIDNQIRKYNHPRLVIKLSAKDRIPNVYDIRAKEIAEDLKKQNSIKTAAEVRVSERAELMMLKAQQDKHDSGGILRCNFHDVEQVFAKPKDTRKVRFEDFSLLQDERPHKKPRLKIRDDLVEKKIGQVPTPRKTVHPKGAKVETLARGALVTKSNGIISKKPGKSLSFSNIKEDSPVPLHILNGVANKSLAFTNNKLALTPAIKKSSKSISFSNMQVEIPAIKKPSFSIEESKIIETPKRPGKSLNFSNITESKVETPATKKPGKSLGFSNKINFFTPTPHKISHNLMANMDASKISEGPNLHILLERAPTKNNSVGEFKIERPVASTSITNMEATETEESQAQAPTEAAKGSSNNVNLPVKRKATRLAATTSFTNMEVTETEESQAQAPTEAAKGSSNNVNLPVKRKSGRLPATTSFTNMEATETSKKFEESQARAPTEAAKGSSNNVYLPVKRKARRPAATTSFTNIDATETSNEESQAQAPTEAAEGSSNSVKNKGGRPPGSKNKRLSFSNIKKNRIRRAAGNKMSNLEEPEFNKNIKNTHTLSTIKESESPTTSVTELNEITTSSNKEPSLKPKTNRTKNTTQKLTQLRGKTTGNDSCDVTESKPGRRRRANNF